VVAAMPAAIPNFDSDHQIRCNGRAKPTFSIENIFPQKPRKLGQRQAAKVVPANGL
jgi:hypothetical protein